MIAPRNWSDEGRGAERPSSPAGGTGQGGRSAKGGPRWTDRRGLSHRCCGSRVTGRRRISALALSRGSTSESTRPRITGG